LTPFDKSFNNFYKDKITLTKVNFRIFKKERESE